MNQIHFIGGEKGGVGKSMVARLLAQYLIDHKRQWRGFDADLSHGALVRYYGDYTQPLDLDVIESLDGLVEQAAEDSDQLLLVDLAAQSERRLHAWAEDVDIAGLGEELGFEITFWHVMDDGKDSVNLLERLLSRYGKSARYVVVKNAARGDRFDLFEQSEVRKSIDEQDIPVIDLRALHHPIVQKIDRMDKSFWAAVNHQGDTDRALGLMERQRVKVWLKRVYESFDNLGLGEPVPET